ncbi:hypothetical protein OG967_39905 [Streptomyces phaeochromogenes]
MGRGLSPLQRQILLLAQDNRDNGRTGDNGIDLYHREVYAAVYGFPTLWGDVRKVGPGTQNFSRNSIGPRVYDSAVSAVSRAMRRLEGRGLISLHSGLISHWSGAQLTEEGHQVAIGLVLGRPAPDSTDSANGSVSSRAGSDLTDTADS